jgi:hypothetical protein
VAEDGSKREQKEPNVGRKMVASEHIKSRGWMKVEGSRSQKEKWCGR